MPNIEDTDPFLRASGDLFQELQMKRAEERGEVVTLDTGLYTIGDSGELEFMDTHESFGEAIRERFEAGYEEAYAAGRADAGLAAGLDDSGDDYA